MVGAQRSGSSGGRTAVAAHAAGLLRRLVSGQRHDGLSEQPVDRRPHVGCDQRLVHARLTDELPDDLRNRPLAVERGEDRARRWR